MRLALPKFLFLPCLALVWLSCDQTLNSAKDQPLVDYVLVVTDSSTNVPLDSVRVRVTTITGDTASYMTDPAEGRAQLATVASSRTLIQLSRRGYNTRDSIDTVNAPVDSVFHRPVTRLLRFKMTRLGLVAVNRAQINLLPRDANLEKLKKATVVFEDSTGDLRTIGDTGATGVVGLNGFKVGKTQVLVKNPGYLGHWFEVAVDRISDTARIPSQVVTLLALGDNRITGQVFYMTGSGSKPLLGAKVQFRLKDTLAVPDTFTVFTSTRPEDFGRFELDSVPALDGQVLYYKDRTSSEALKSVPILREEVLRDGPLPSLTLSIGSDSSLPFLVEGPKDSVGPKDSLVFRFNQKVDVVEGYSVRLINQSQLLVDTAWNKERTQLRIWQKDANWIRGKKYEFQVVARNGAGQYFTAQGDSLKVLKGIFSIPDSGTGADSSMLLPKNIAFSYFNSGGYYLFTDADSNSSPKPDSTSEFARLKWNWSAGTGHKVDSLLLYYKDGGISADNWTLWGALPGFLDSATIVFSEHYATSRAANQRPVIPFKSAGGKIFFRIVPKQGGKTFADTSLDAIEQGMGPTVYSHIIPEKTNPPKSKNGESDSLLVVFLKRDNEPSNVFDWGGSQPQPFIYFNGVKQVDTTIEKWKWLDGKSGHIVYTLPNPVTTASRFGVDLNGQLFLGRPIWHRNCKNEFVLP